jgi:mRNA interferase RelE/StbE
VAWTYKVHEDADRQLKVLGPAARKEVVAWLEKRIHGANDPTQFGKPLRGSKHGLWRYRVRNYRIICKLENEILVVVVVAVGHRSTIYDG